MISTLQDFEDGTTFELFVLEKICPAIEKRSNEVLDLRSEDEVHKHSSVVDCADEAVNGLKATLTPLLFGAAWKVLDLLLEYAFDRAGIKPRQHPKPGRPPTWKIDEKQKYAQEARGDISVLGCSPGVWTALLLTYAGTVEHRHCLVHRTAKVSEESGVLEGVDRNDLPLKPLTREEQVALAKISGLVARGVLSGRIEQRSEENLKYYLNVLGAHSGFSQFAVGKVSPPIEIKLLLTQEDGIYFFNLSGVLERVRKIFPTANCFNLNIDVPDGSGRHLFALAENCPSGKWAIDLDALPPWLELR